MKNSCDISITEKYEAGTEDFTLDDLKHSHTEMFVGFVVILTRYFDDDLVTIMICIQFDKIIQNLITIFLLVEVIYGFHNKK